MVVLFYFECLLFFYILVNITCKKNKFKCVGNEKKMFFFYKKKKIAAVLTDAKSPEKRGKNLHLTTVGNCRKHYLNRR
jgi:hypothetical protein